MSGSAFEIPWFEAIEDKVMLLSGLILLFTIFVQTFADACCDDSECSTNQADNFSKKLTFFAAGLYAVNLVIFFLQH
ncbi:MAG: hypothetical protein HRT47_13380 [Candidatus Caenarcaniphilales bacterium]|nr:hypothetical protein [Candidatus Caenarcaniphilales bacterium]